MATITIDVPDYVKRFIEERMKSDGYPAAGYYIRDLVQRDNQDKMPPEDPALQALLLERVRSDKWVTLEGDTWQERKASFDRLIAEARQKRLAREAKASPSSPSASTSRSRKRSKSS